MSFLDNLAAGLSGFGAGVNDPSYALKAMAEKRKEDKKLEQQSMLLKLAQGNNPEAMMRANANTPEGLTKLAEYLQEQNKPKDRKTIKGNDGFNYFQDTGERVLPNVEAKDKDRKIIKGMDGRSYYPDTGEAVLPNVKAPTDKPLSPEGKLAVDLEKGLITQDIFDAASKDPEKAISFKDPQLKASSFGNRMIESAKLFNPIFDELNKAGESVVGAGAEMLASLPTMLGGKMLSNQARSGAQQRFRNAANEWIRAKLRKESGAVIAEDEMDEEYRTYFPVIGDEIETIEQKTKLRATATDSMIKESAGAYESLYKKDSNSDNMTAAEQKELRELERKYPNE